MELTFLGTGAAFAGDAFNAGYVLDRRLLIDAGAPVHVLLKQTGHDVGKLEGAVITHQHGDHTFGLPFLMAMRAIEHPQAPPFTIAGPVGFGRYIEDLVELAWGGHLRDIVWERLRPRFIDVSPGDDFDVAGFRVHAEEMAHVPELLCLGFHLARDGVSFGFSGDTGVCPGLDALVEMSQDFLVEMTGFNEEASGHMTRPDVEALVAANPGKRFFLTHLNRAVVTSDVAGAVVAQDLQTVELQPAG
ncbi:MAG: hypothetical protein QOE92_1287 [Chloroflexota bacterium]|jgi:ribonuclease BN (tRNA processing enzyme)|nr:hypothetical protein [Chloroflexota bacterium]